MLLRGIALSAALAISPIVANAGNLAPVAVETPVVIEPVPAPQSSASGWIVPAVIIGLLAVAVSAGDTGCGAKGLVTGC